MESIKKASEEIMNQAHNETATNCIDTSIGYVEYNLNGKEDSKWILRNPKSKNFTFVTDIHGVPVNTKLTGHDILYTNNNCIWRDSILGGFLIMHGVGDHHYKPRTEVFPLGVSLFGQYVIVRDKGGDACNGIIKVKDGTEFAFESLEKEREKLKKLLGERDELEQELEEKENNEIIEEAEKLKFRIAEKDKEIVELRQKIKKHIAREVALRDQPMLDKHQEAVKRSKILDGGLIINGGPGTGKTTSLIQRVTYLTSPTIEEKKALTPEQQNLLYDQKRSWVFYSPSELLRDYLANAMTAEGLHADDERVKTWNSHRKGLTLSTGLIVPGQENPFTGRLKDEKEFFHPNAKAFTLLKGLFLDFYLEQQKKKIEKVHQSGALKPFNKDASSENTAFELEKEKLGKLAVQMQDGSRRALSFTTIKEWISFFIIIQEDLSTATKRVDKEVLEELDNAAAKIQAKLNRKEDLLKWLTELVIQEQHKTAVLNDEEEDEDEDELAEVNLHDNIGTEKKINQKIKSLLRKVSLQKFDKDVKLSEKDKTLYGKLFDLFDETVLPSIGLKLYFKKYFEKPTKGVEFNLLNAIPAQYKRFRKIILKDSTELLTPHGLTTIEKVIKDHNKALYRDEADFLLCFIFSLGKDLFNINKKYFDQSSHPFIATYRQNIKGVVAIDEATDFSVWELAAMSGLAHPFFNSVTLSGDLMQRMTAKGIQSWEEYESILPNTEVKDLKKAYRQTAKLLGIASDVYTHCVGVKASFEPHHEGDDLDPNPLFFIGNDQDSKIDWLVNRILEINSLYSGAFPTVAIFVKNDTEASNLEKLLEEREELEDASIEVTACVKGKILGDKQNVRIFSVEYIKGLEFGAVFFMDLDKMEHSNQDLLNKYLYVGLSRANLFLGVTFEEDWPEEMAYLQPHFKSSTWKSKM